LGPETAILNQTMYAYTISFSQLKENDKINILYVEIKPIAYYLLEKGFQGPDCFPLYARVSISIWLPKMWEEKCDAVDVAANDDETHYNDLILEINVNFRYFSIIVKF
jgi:hypothetical protein